MPRELLQERASLIQGCNLTRMRINQNDIDLRAEYLCAKKT